MNVDVVVLEICALNVIVLKTLILFVVKMDVHMVMNAKLDVMDKIPLMRVNVIQTHVITIWIALLLKDVFLDVMPVNV
jgi:hypothetical protein